MERLNSITKQRSSEGAQSVHRALSILEAVCQAEGSASLHDLSESVGLNKVTVHRLLRALQSDGFVVQDPVSRHYLPGLRLFELTYQVIAKMELKTVAEPEIQALSREVNETVHLAVLDDGDVVYLDKKETQHTIRMYSAIGKRGPAHCTGVGKVLLAYLPGQQLEEIVQRKGLRVYTDNTISTLERLNQHLAVVREKGYAIDDAEHESEVMCVAAPIRDSTRQVVAAVSITVPSLRCSREQIEAKAPLVQETARRISRKMGYVPTSVTQE